MKSKLFSQSSKKKNIDVITVPNYKNKSSSYFIEGKLPDKEDDLMHTQKNLLHNPNRPHIF